MQTAQPARSFSHASHGKLYGKRALVTGSTSGIGLGIARTFASHGCSIMLNGFGDEREITKLSTDLSNQYGVAVGYYPADISKPQQIAEMISYTEKGLGGIDILVNNAGACACAKNCVCECAYV